jgi:hypothetical protein
MKNFIIRFWWLFPLLFAASILISAYFDSMWPIFFVISVPLTFVAMITSWIILLIFKKWWRFLCSFILGALTVTYFLYQLNIAIGLAFNPGPDDFGKEHPIPASLAYNIPLMDGEDATALVDSTESDTFLQIWNDFQGGMYMYDFYHPALEEGWIYLRCYEATENIPLSPERISEASMVATPSTTSFSKVVEKQCFTIYPGDWGDYYAARIEVWHKDAKTGKERKLMEKVYRVEGWMR